MVGDPQFTASRQQHCLSAARIAAFCIFIAGACGIVGWIGDIMPLAQPSPLLAPMSLVTAMLLCLVAIALVMRSFARSNLLRGGSLLIGLVVCAIGLWTLKAYSFGGGLPFDTWLADRSLAASLGHRLNRMSPVSGICFALFGAASCLGIPSRRGSSAALQILAAAGVLISLVSLIGYLYSIASLVSLADYKPIAPQSALAFLFCFVALFLSSPDKGVMATILSDELGGILARRLLVFVFILPVLLGGIASAGLRLGVLTGPTSIFFLTASTDLSLAGLLLFNAFTINRSEQGRRGAQKSLMESERAYRALFENAADPMFLVSRDLVVQEANTAAAASLGRPAPLMRGSHFTDLACTADVGRKLQNAFVGQEASFEVCAHAADGHDVPLEVRAREVEFRGAPTVLIIARDLSERRRADRALAEKEALLQQAQKMEAIGRLAGGVAHDFNNLLTVIMGYSELLMGKLGPSHEGHPDAMEIKMCAGRAAALTRQLLAFSRRQPNAPRSVDVNGIVREMTPLLGRLLGEKISLDVQLHAHQSCIRIDPNQLEQIVLNLAVNARDAMPDGGTLIIESAERSVAGEILPLSPAPPDGAYVELAVHDTGTGIPAEVQPHIFEPFYTTKTEGQGTGLGLSTVYGIVTQNNGTIGVQSSSAGTTMRLLFPLMAAAEDEPLSPPGRTSPAVQPTSALLLVEDESCVRQYLAAGLRREGYAVLEACSGEEALRLAGSFGGSIDVVVSDVVMPGIGGRRLADELVRRLPRARILFMSGYDRDEGEEADRLCGGFDLIGKPFTAAELVERIGKLEKNEPAASAAGLKDAIQGGPSAASV